MDLLVISYFLRLLPAKASHSAKRCFGDSLLQHIYLVTYEGLFVSPYLFKVTNQLNFMTNPVLLEVKPFFK